MIDKILIAVIITASILLGIQTYRLHDLNSAVAELQAKLNNELAANNILQANISTCTDAIKADESTIEALKADHQKSLDIIQQIKSNPAVKIIPLQPKQLISGTNPVISDTIKQALTAVGAAR